MHHKMRSNNNNNNDKMEDDNTNNISNNNDNNSMDLSTNENPVITSDSSIPYFSPFPNMVAFPSHQSLMISTSKRSKSTIIMNNNNNNNNNSTKTLFVDYKIPMDQFNQISEYLSFFDCIRLINWIFNYRSQYSDITTESSLINYINYQITRHYPFNLLQPSASLFQKIKGTLQAAFYGKNLPLEIYAKYINRLIRESAETEKPLLSRGISFQDVPMYYRLTQVDSYILSSLISRDSRMFDLTNWKAVCKRELLDSESYSGFLNIANEIKDILFFIFHESEDSTCMIGIWFGNSYKNVINEMKLDEKFKTSFPVIKLYANGSYYGSIVDATVADFISNLCYIPGFRTGILRNDGESINNAKECLEDLEIPLKSEIEALINNRKIYDAGCYNFMNNYRSISLNSLYGSERS